MKLIFMTESEVSGTFDVFNSVLIPEAAAPVGFIDRWRSIINASPIEPLICSGKENLFLGSSYNPESGLFTLAENIPQEAAKSLDEKFAVFLINNIVVGIATIPFDKEYLEAAYSSPVVLVELDDGSPVESGYIWNGTEFIAPVLPN